MRSLEIIKVKIKVATTAFKLQEIEGQASLRLIQYNFLKKEILTYVPKSVK